jgi:cold shock CspA family protein
LFGSYPIGYDLKDDDAVQGQLDFYAMLKEEYHYELELFPIDFEGRRVRRRDRDPQDPFQPKEKCVDISLATSMLYFAAIPYVYDIAVAVVGDQDYKPVLQHVRRLGKRVGIASIKRHCTDEFSDPRDEARVKDFDIIWLNDLLDKLELKYEAHQRLCESPFHKGDKRVWTTFHPRKGRKFYCEKCRDEFRKQKQDAQQDLVASGIDMKPDVRAGVVAQTLTGEIKKKVPDRGFGFIRAGDGNDYFFHLTDLSSDLGFDQATEGLKVDFEVKGLPAGGKAGAAQNVRRHAPSPAAAEVSEVASTGSM